MSSLTEAHSHHVGGHGDHLHNVLISRMSEGHDSRTNSLLAMCVHQESARGGGNRKPFVSMMMTCEDESPFVYLLPNEDWW